MVFETQNAEEHTAKNINVKPILTQLIKQQLRKIKKIYVAAYGSVNCNNIRRYLEILYAI